MENKGVTGTQPQEDLNGTITEQLESGKSQGAVVRGLVLSGMTESEANQAVERVSSQMKQTAGEEEFSSGALVPAILGGLLAALIGGAIWGGIAIWTGSEIGYVALGVGFLCGTGVVLITGGKKGAPLQAIALVASLLGIAIGKYVNFFSVVKEITAEERGAEAAATMSLFSVEMVQFFGDSIPAMASGYDALWVVLAVYMAWSIPKASGLKI
jgi:hypothetical protein